MSRGRGLGKLLFGVAVGVGLGFLFAPKEGAKTRAELKVKLGELLEKAKEVDVEEVKNKVLTTVEDLKKELENLDQEKAAELAKKEADKIAEKAEELYKYVVEKGTPVLEKAVEEVKDKAIKMAKEIIEKVEKDKATK